MDASRRLFETFLPDCELYCSTIMEEMEKRTDSPIEALLGAAVWMSLAGSSMRRPHLARYPMVVLCEPQEIEDFPTYSFRMVPQYPWNGYRIDFALVNESGKICFVECDGHDFHERTKEQAARDRAKDRAILLAGIPLMRFTGSEIWRDPFNCVREIAGMMTRLIEQ